MGVIKWTLTLSAIVVAYFVYRFVNPYETKSDVIKIGELGAVQGVVSTSRGGREFSKFLGIPYAKPPVGSLRFESPQEPEPWEGVKLAIRAGSECPQRSFLTGNPGGDEDCLYLNIYVPRLKTNDLLPVMFFIHGGAFYEGSSTFYDGSYFMDHDVILVTINYRLGALGFLNTNDGLIRGSMGLKDQTMALKWVNRYIRYFGGDNQRVTIFGESAGGASVHYHMMSPMSKGLFHRAISQSGTGFQPRAFFAGDTGEQAKRLARQAECPVDSSEAMVKCLKSISHHKLVELNFIDIGNPLREVISLYEPTVESIVDEDTFLSDHPYNLVSKLESSVPWMTGMNSHEGLLNEAVLARSDALRQTLASDWTHKLPYLLHMNPKYSEISDQIKDFYFQSSGGGHIHFEFDKASENYTNLLSDRGFLYGFHEAVRLHVDKALSPTFLYYFEYQGRFSLYQLLVALKGNYPPLIEALWHLGKTWISRRVYGIEPPSKGVCHADELQYLFPLFQGAEIDAGHPDYELSKELVRLWVSFAKEEKQLHFNQVQWKPAEKVTGKKLKYLRIGKTASIAEEPFRERMLFWDGLKDYYWGYKV